ncbi:MAG TPA: four helix bundle protein [Candidatus Paceibacterota bacterium]|nr:four helix bundle protein [Candidatus Paceibacterota bacterium]HMP19204.1 four helix bundle protein [Candidatus Paceibacterota bacterium]HMP85354.1 four helix bundle protein [Candidatus Paceibacterota bacterium]
MKSVYSIWYENYLKIPKTHRYTLALKIDNLFIEIIEGISIAVFLKKEEKIPWLNFSIRKIETLHLLLQILWETKSLNNKKYIQISEKLNEIGKMLNGWSNKIKNSSK